MRDAILPLGKLQVGSWKSCISQNTMAFSSKKEKKHKYSVKLA